MSAVRQAELADKHDQVPEKRSRSTQRNVLVFAVATGLGRLTGLAREIVAARLFGVSAAMSAFTIAFQIPNLLRALFADSALQGAFIPVFTDLQQKGRRLDAFRMASNLCVAIICILGSICALLALFAPILVHVFAPGFSSTPGLDELTASLTRIMIPVVTVIALSGVVVGVLNSYDRFTLAAIAPAVFNVTIVAGMLCLRPLVSDAIYAYAFGVLAASFCQLLVILPGLRGTGFHFRIVRPVINPAVVDVLKLMLPTTLALGLINFDALLNLLLGTLVSSETPAAIEKAFRIYQLPQGLFSVAIATVLYPQLARSASAKTDVRTREILGSGMRYSLLFMVPSATLMIVLAHPMIEAIYQRGAFGDKATEITSQALIWWGVTLPFTGLSTLLWRAFLSVRRPWIMAGVSAASLVVNIIVSLALYKPFGIAGIVIGTAVSTAGMVLVGLPMVASVFGGIQGRVTGIAACKMILAATVLAATSYFVWKTTSGVLGVDFLGRCTSLLIAIVTGVIVYSLALLVLGLGELKTILGLGLRPLSHR